MAVKASDRIVEAMPWLDPLADTVKTALAPVLGPKAPKELQDWLNGTWLGHPLHPVIVAVPIGAWTVTMLLDLAGLEDGADLSLQLGLLAALGAAATGAAQWQDTWGKARRLGILHASLNVGAVTLYGLSALLRAGGARKAGVALSTTGYGIASFSAWLGGDLAYDLGIGINRTAFEEPPTDWIDVLDEAELKDNTPQRVVANGVPIMLLRQGGETFAISATCTHLGCALNEGTIEGETVTCPCHGSVFSLRDGRVIHGPATMPEPAFDVRAQNGKIAVRSKQ